MVKSKSNRNSIGQITVKKIGKVYAVCISGTPKELYHTYLKAEEIADNIREKYGRRCKRSTKKYKKKKLNKRKK